MRRRDLHIPWATDPYERAAATVPTPIVPIETIVVAVPPEEEEDPPTDPVPDEEATDDLWQRAAAALDDLLPDVDTD